MYHRVLNIPLYVHFIHVFLNKFGKTLRGQASRNCGQGNLQRHAKKKFFKETKKCTTVVQENSPFIITQVQLGNPDPG